MPRPARKRTENPRGGPAADADRVRERILVAFSAKAKRSGIRAVVMGELASELRMSPVTLYKHFASKDDLVSAMIDAWALELAAIDALDLGHIPDCDVALERLLIWADAWTANLSNVAPSFFGDLSREHPDSWDRFQKQLDARKWAAAPLLTPFLRPELNANVALQMLDRFVTQAADPRYAERLGVSRSEAVHTVVSIWCGGALTPPRLRPVGASRA